jgi:hypothetical protein
MQTDLEQRDERPTQFFERVTRKRNERLKQLPQATERPANSFVFRGAERRVAPLAVGGKALMSATVTSPLSVFALDRVDADTGRAVADFHNSAAAFPGCFDRPRRSRQLVWNFVWNREASPFASFKSR